MSEDRRLVTWKQLVEMGWPYSRYHTTHRMIPEGRFPNFEKFGPHRGARIVWLWVRVKHFFEPSDKA
jgi:hypothetical protein